VGAGDADIDDLIAGLQRAHAVNDLPGQHIPACARLIDDRHEGLLRHAGIVLQHQALHRRLPARLAAFVELAHQACEGDDGAGIASGAAQLGVKRCHIEIGFLHTEHAQPPVIGGKKAISSAPVSG